MMTRKIESEQLLLKAAQSALFYLTYSQYEGWGPEHTIALLRQAIDEYEKETQEAANDPR